MAICNTARDEVERTYINSIVLKYRAIGQISEGFGAGLDPFALNIELTTPGIRAFVGRKECLVYA